MIVLDRVTKTYNDKSIALKKVSLKISPKEFVIIIGKSGAGKTTLLRLLTREERQTERQISWKNEAMLVKIKVLIYCKRKVVKSKEKI